MADIPAEAVEAAMRSVRENYERLTGRGAGVIDRVVVRLALAAALPHLRERWLAEVEGALRDEAMRVIDAARGPKQGGKSLADHQSRGLRHAADYLRDVLGAGAGGEGE